MDKLIKLKSFVKPYWKQSVWSLVLLTAVVFMDLAIPRLIQKIIDEGIGNGDSQVVFQTMFVMLGISVLSALFAIGNNFLSVQAGEGFARDLREAMYLNIQKFSFGNLDHLRTGQLIVRLTTDITILQRVVRMLLRIGTRAPMLMVGSLILMFNTNTRLAFEVLPLLILLMGVIVLFVMKMGPLFSIVQEKLDRLNTVLQENIAGVRVVKAFDRAEYEGKRFEDANEDFTAYTVRVMQLMSTMFPVLMILVNVGIVVVIWAGGLQSIQGELSIGEVVAFTNYLLTTTSPLMIMAMLSHVLAAGVASAERVDEVLGVIPEVEDRPGARSLQEIRKQSDVGVSGGSVRFKGVWFHYNGASDAQVLEDITLSAEPGETVAVLGATGSGKSTLINLIPRFYDVTGGRILVDGVDVREMSQDSLLAQVGIVPQETVLFSGSVRDNIRYGRPEASDKAVEAAAKAAQAHDFIMELPAGYDTRVEQRGINLSGGQKQRIAIARALLTEPRILILDDSTSSVDVETETRIQEALEERMRHCTTFVVAQRISTVLNADKIIVLEKGRIAAQGNHNELMQTSPIYQEIYDSQLGDGAMLQEAAVKEEWRKTA